MENMIKKALQQALEQAGTQAELDARIILDDRIKEVTSLNFPRQTVEERANWYNVEDASHELR